MKYDTIVRLKNTRIMQLGNQLHQEVQEAKYYSGLEQIEKFNTHTANARSLKIQIDIEKISLLD